MLLKDITETRLLNGFIRYDVIFKGCYLKILSDFKMTKKQAKKELLNQAKRYNLI